MGLKTWHPVLSVSSTVLAHVRCSVREVGWWSIQSRACLAILRPLAYPLPGTGPYRLLASGRCVRQPGCPGRDGGRERRGGGVSRGPCQPRAPSAATKDAPLSSRLPPKRPVQLGFPWAAELWNSVPSLHATFPGSPCGSSPLSYSTVFCLASPFFLHPSSHFSVAHSFSVGT